MALAGRVLTVVIVALACVAGQRLGAADDAQGERASAQSASRDGSQATAQPRVWDNSSRTLFAMRFTRETFRVSFEELEPGSYRYRADTWGLLYAGRYGMGGRTRLLPGIEAGIAYARGTGAQRLRSMNGLGLGASIGVEQGVGLPTADDLPPSEAGVRVSASAHGHFMVSTRFFRSADFLFDDPGGRVGQTGALSRTAIELLGYVAMQPGPSFELEFAAGPVLRDTRLKLKREGTGTSPARERRTSSRHNAVDGLMSARVRFGALHGGVFFTTHRFWGMTLGFDF